MENQLVNPESTVYKVALTAKLHLIGLYSQTKNVYFVKSTQTLWFNFVLWSFCSRYD